MRNFVINTILLSVIVIIAVGPATASAQEETFRLATWNLEWFFDQDTSDNTSNLSKQQSAPNQNEFNERVDTFADAIAEINPTIIALQEIENQKVVQDIADRLQEEHSLAYEVAFVQGRDTFTEQDVAYLIKQGIPFNASRFDFTNFVGNHDFKDLSKHLKLEVIINGEEITLVTIHLISSSPSDRIKQAKTLRAWTEAMVSTDDLIILGDFNTGLRFQEVTPDSDLGIIRGFQTSITTDDLFDAHQLLNPRETHVTGKEFDHILVSPVLRDQSGLDLASVETRRDLAIRGTEDTSSDGVAYSLPQNEQDLSDHFPVVAAFSMAGAPTATPAPTPLTNEEKRALLLEKITHIENEITGLIEELQQIKALLRDLDN